MENPGDRRAGLGQAFVRASRVAWAEGEVRGDEDDGEGGGLANTPVVGSYRESLESRGRPAGCGSDEPFSHTGERRSHEIPRLPFTSSANPPN